MSNEFTFFRPEAVSFAIDEFATLLREVLTTIGRSDLLDPYRDEFRIRPPVDGALAIEVDLHLAPDAVVKVAAPLACNAEDMRGGIGELGKRLTALLGDLDQMMHLRGKVEREARSMMKRAARAGVKGRVIEVRLGAIDLVSPFGGGKLQVLVEGAACHMLRPFRDTWQINDLDDLAEAFSAFRAVQVQRDAKRRAANARGAVGFVDALALALIDERPEGRKATLQEISRQLDLRWYRDLGDGHPEAHGLAWYDGVVRASTRLSDRLSLTADTVLVRGVAIDQSAVGRTMGAFVQHPWLGDLKISTVDVIRDGFADVRLDAAVVAFTAEGDLLPSN